MNEPFHEPLTVWRFIRRNSVRIVIGVVLMTAVYGALLVWVPYEREQRIVREIEALGGRVKFQYAGPDWIPQSVRNRATLFSRVTKLDLMNTQITDPGLEHLKGLTRLEMLDLSNTQVTDGGLEHLKGLSNLELLALDNTRVTDAGLEHLKELSNLDWLHLVGTQTTAEGIELLRKALPGCGIYPEP